MNRIFIGTDLRQPIGYNVLQHSIQVTAKAPVQIVPLYKHQLPIKRTGLTDFTFSRYLVPWLCDFQGTALFMDADMLALVDINELFQWYEHQYGADRPAVSCVLDQPEFEWPSLMMFDCAQCEHLTVEYVNDERNAPNDLRRWVARMGALPREWNVMMRASAPDEGPGDAKVLHFTEGLPCFYETQRTPGAASWQAMKNEMNYTVNWQSLMGKSVHAKPVILQLLRHYGVLA